MQSGSERELKVAPRWFEVTEVADGVFRITEPYVHAYVRSNSWLIRGRDSHLLVDSGLGIGSLPDELADYLDRPVIAVATHAHFDHFGGLAEFADRAAHRDDGAVIEQEILTAERNAALRLALRELPPRCQQLVAMLISDPPHSYAEISAALRIPMGSIGPQRSRCLEHLRRSAALARLNAGEMRVNSAGGE